MDNSKISYYETNDATKRTYKVLAVLFYVIAIGLSGAMILNFVTPESPNYAEFHIIDIALFILIWFVPIILTFASCSKACNTSIKISGKTLTITVKNNSKTYDLSKLQSYAVDKVSAQKHRVFLIFDSDELQIYTRGFEELKPILDEIIKGNEV
jgi:hypothetical protein